MLSVEEARAKVLDGVTTLPAESVAIGAAAGRTLAAAVTAKLTQPPFNASAMDGYAVRAADIASVPVELPVVSEAAAGAGTQTPFSPQTAVRIFTGAPVPDGADTVIIQENTERHGATVSVQISAKAGANIRPHGQDFSAGETLLSAGRRLSARDVLLAAAGGHATLPVVRKPVVALLATGNELVEPGEAPGPGQIIASNSYGLSAMIEAAGGEARMSGIARDRKDDLAAALARAQDADILVTIGGASVGDHDLVRPTLEAAGARLGFYKVAMQPGKPVFFGRRTTATREQICMGLPGNPVSAMVTARVFLIPLIARMLGRDEPFQTVPAALGAPVAANGPRAHFMRASLDTSTLPARATPLAKQDSSMVTIFAKADCLILIPPGSPALDAGTPVQIVPLDF